MSFRLRYRYKCLLGRDTNKILTLLQASCERANRNKESNDWELRCSEMFGQIY